MTTCHACGRPAVVQVRGLEVARPSEWQDRPADWTDYCEEHAAVAVTKAMAAVLVNAEVWAEESA